MQHSFDQLIQDLESLITRIRSRESAVDEIRQQVAFVQAQLRGVRNYQEEVLNFTDLSNRVANKPKGPLILALAAENRQLEQLRLENQALCDSLDEHQTALDLIMQKYRTQMSTFMRTKQVEQIVQSDDHPPRGSSANLPKVQPPRDLTNGHLVTSHPINGSRPSQPTSHPSTAKADPTFRTLFSTLAAIAQDVCSGSDTYATELETELHRLRSENNGLRELLAISDACNLDPVSSTSLSDASCVPDQEGHSRLPEPPQTFGGASGGIDNAGGRKDIYSSASGLFYTGRVIPVLSNNNSGGQHEEDEGESSDAGTVVDVNTHWDVDD